MPRANPAGGGGSAHLSTGGQHVGSKNEGGKRGGDTQQSYPCQDFLNKRGRAAATAVAIAVCAMPVQVVVLKAAAATGDAFGVTSMGCCQVVDYVGQEMMLVPLLTW